MELGLHNLCIFLSQGSNDLSHLQKISFIAYIYIWISIKDIYLFFATMIIIIVQVKGQMCGSCQLLYIAFSLTHIGLKNY